MRAGPEQVEDYHKVFTGVYGNIPANNRLVDLNSEFCKFWACPNCGSLEYPSHTRAGVNKYTLFEEAIKCPDCGYVMRGFNYSELLFRLVNQFTPLFSKPMDTDYKTEPEKYLAELNVSRNRYTSYLYEFKLWRLVDKYHSEGNWVYESHRDVVYQQITYYRRKAWEYAARKHQACFFCGSNENLEHHHIIPVSEGGDNSHQNLISLCFSCHKKVHRMRSMERKMICSIA
jgi:hypothetical protein